MRQIEIASEIWNFCIAMRRMYYMVYGKKLKANDLKKYIAKICKRRKWAHWHNLGSQAIQDVVERGKLEKPMVQAKQTLQVLVLL